ncbi:MAG: flagellar biosynthetic protein FliR [Methylocystis sp.]|nr:MAG: flagellar biosynthetic protein FliR [Methylocystis sp.]
MAAPGFSTERTPVLMRLYLSIGLTLSIAPPLMEKFTTVFLHSDPSGMLATILVEMAIGVALGLLARFYFLALETLAASVAMTFGLGNIFGAPIMEAEAAPALSTFITTSALTIVFVTDGHFEIIRALYGSYDAAPILQGPGAGGLLLELTRALSQAHLLALRVCSPFLIFGLIVNLGLGLLSKLTPQIQVYFVASPLVILLGLYAFSLLYADFFTAFSSHFRMALND